MATTYIDNYSELLERLHSNQITFIEFLKEAKCYSQFEDWCNSHRLVADEGAAQCYFDHSGFEDSNVIKEFVEPIV